MVPTVGVYPIATANDKSQISAPLMSRFAVIDIPDYTKEEKKIIFSRFALPKVLKRMSLKKEECIVTEEGLEAVMDIFAHTSGIRDLEQAAEHIAANHGKRITGTVRNWKGKDRCSQKFEKKIPFRKLWIRFLKMCSQESFIREMRSRQSGSWQSLLESQDLCCGRCCGR